MSRKRGKKQQAVPDEVLAEGSGPVEGETVVRVGLDAIAGDVDELASAAADVGIEAVARQDEVAEAVVVEPADAVDAEVIEATPDSLEEISEEEAAELGAALPTSAASMDPTQLKFLVESLVFASDKPITVQRLRQLTRVSDVRRLEQALADLAEDYRDRGIVLQQVSGGYQFRTRTQFSTWVQQLIAGRPVRLSRAQLETLAIIAYRQPITRPEIDDIRGVDSTATLKLLLDRALIRILGKKEEAGRPMLYGTTKDFLDFFSLGDLRELPTLREYSELTDESRAVITDRLGDEPEATEEAEVEIETKPETIDDLVASYTASITDSTAGDEAPDVRDASAVDDSAPTGAFDATPDSATTGVFHAEGSEPIVDASVDEEILGLDADATDADADADADDGNGDDEDDEGDEDALSVLAARRLAVPDTQDDTASDEPASADESSTD